MALDRDLFSPQRPSRPERPALAAEAAAAPLTVAGAPFDHVCFVCGALAPFGRGSLRRGEPMQWACRRHREKLR